MRSIRRDIVGAFIVSNDGYLLLGHSASGGVYPDYVIVPGGGLEEGESKHEALIREILEETSLDIRDAQIELVNDTESGQSEKTLRGGERVLVHMSFNDFHVRMSKAVADLPLKAGDDFAEPQWVAVRDLPNLKLVESTKVTLKKLGYL